MMRLLGLVGFNHAYKPTKTGGGLLYMPNCYTAKALAQSVQKDDSFLSQVQKPTMQHHAVVRILFEYFFQKLHAFQF
jgi:hypothetical protein